MPPASAAARAKAVAALSGSSSSRSWFNSSANGGGSNHKFADGCVTQVPLRRFFEQFPPDQHATDFAGAGADLVEFGVAQQPPGRIVVDVAVAAEQLDGVERALRRLLRRVEDRAGRVLARG